MLDQRYPAVVIIGIGWPLKDGYPLEKQAADFDDWATETRSEAGEIRHGLSGEILVWNPVTQRRHELMSGGIRVTPTTLRQQLEISGPLDLLRYPYPPAILLGDVPLGIGGGSARRGRRCSSCPRRTSARSP